MELNDYQKKAMSTCMDTSRNFSYMMLNLVGEVGEFSSKVAKSIRKGKAWISGDSDLHTIEENNDDLKKELGDILWQVAGLSTVMGWKLEDVAQDNLTKLQARRAAGTIDGSGDGISGAERN